MFIYKIIFQMEKMRPIETILRREEGIKENDRGGEFS
jgi:hypothetical protein